MPNLIALSRQNPWVSDPAFTGARGAGNHAPVTIQSRRGSYSRSVRTSNPKETFMSVAASRFFSLAPARLALAVATACAAPAALAQAALPPGVGVYLQNSLNAIGSSSYASSGTVSIYSAGGLQVDPTPYNYALTSPNTMPLGLTTATLSSGGSNIPLGHAAAEASATADLAGGILRSATSTSANVPYRQVGPVSTRVITTSAMQDYVTFAVASAQGADVVFTTHLDGSYVLSDPYYGNGNAQVQVIFGAASFGYSGHADVSGSIYGHHTDSPHGRGLDGWTSYSFSNETPTGFDFTGTMHVTDRERMQMFAGLYLDCAYSSCGFGNTARVGLHVPNGVSFTSDSGVFLTGASPVAPVPEPETWALMVAGLAVVGRTVRRGRNVVRD